MKQQLFLLPAILSILISFQIATLAYQEGEGATFRTRVFSITSNANGRILRTSEGIFYIGRSGDAIRDVNGYKRYGYWEQEGSTLKVYIDDMMYEFQLNIR
ncbi:MAG: hypothetical protein N5P05_004141 (plasmid) [Chroococcopsis gigantea SAG 12.99]|jgi:hypothetical protein|nr:hypothetical protein [Chroococcopsis gigantea SAG 12.99]